MMENQEIEKEIVPENEPGMPDNPEISENPEITEEPETPEVSENPETPEDTEAPESPEAPENTEMPEVPEKKKSGFRFRLRFSKKLMVIILLIEALVLVEVFHLLSMSVSLNSDDTIQYAGTDYEDTINYQDGALTVNDVSVSVPHNSSVTYNIAYSWGREDTEYPTVPHSVTAVYKGEDEKPMYDITLYRDSYIPAKEIPKGKDAKNWFSDWETVDNEDIKQQAKDSKDVHGFMIDTLGDGSDQGPASDYETSTYYFATQTKKGLSVYILEGILYDKEHLDEFRKTFDDSINSITIKKQKKQAASQ